MELQHIQVDMYVKGTGDMIFQIYSCQVKMSQNKLFLSCGKITILDFHISV